MNRKKAPDDMLIEEILEEARMMRREQEQEHPEQTAGEEVSSGPPLARAVPVQAQQPQDPPAPVKEPARVAPQKEPEHPVQVQEPPKKMPPVLETIELEALLAKDQRPQPEWAQQEPEPEEPSALEESAPKLTWRQRRAEKKRLKEERRLAKRKEKEVDEEDDIYYGIQLRPLSEYQQAYADTLNQTGESARKGTPAPGTGGSTFSYLFDSSEEELDEEITERFETLRKERRQRAEQAMKEAGAEPEDLFNLYQPQDRTMEVQLPKTQKEVSAPQVEEAAQAPKKEPKQESIPLPPGGETFEFPMVGDLNRAARTVPIEPIQGAAFELPPLTALEEQPPKTKPAEPTEPVLPVPPTQPVEPTVPPSPPAEPEPPEQPQSDPETAPPEVPVAEPQTVVQPMRAEDEPVLIPDLTEPARRTCSIPPAQEGEYRVCDALPLHVIELQDYKEVLLKEAKTYPKPASLHTPQAAPQQEHVQAPVLPVEPKAEPEDAPEEELHAPKKFKIVGTDEPENEPEENLTQDEPEELDDYQDEQDIPSVQHELSANLRSLTLRLGVTGILFVLMLAISFLGEMSAGLLPFLNVSIPTQTYLFTQLILLVMACAFCSVTLWNGIRGLFRFKANADTAVAVASVAALVQAGVLPFFSQKVAQGQLHTYAVLVAGALFLNTLGKFSLVKRILHNFHFVASPEQKYTVQLFDDYNTALQMAKGTVLDSPSIAYQKRTGFLKNFLHISYENDPSDLSAQVSAPVGLVLSLLLCGATFYFTRDVSHAVTAFTAGVCMCVPIANMICVNFPLAHISKIAARCGAMIAGYPAVERFSSVNAVMVDAKDLFPKGTVVLNGIKTFAGQHLDDAIMDATALMYATGGPLSDLFDQIIQSRREMLPKTENIVYEDGRGVTGWVSGRRVLVGNRELMIQHSIEPPSRDYEEKYLFGGKQVVYFASGGELMAMFVVSYSSDRRRAQELRRMEDNGITLLVRTCDPNITPALLAEVFMLGQHSIRVLPEDFGKIYTGLVEKPVQRSEALLATKGRPTAMMRILTACIRQSANISMALVLQNVAVILGFLLVAFLALYSGLPLLTTRALVLFQVFWVAAILIVPKLRRP